MEKELVNPWAGPPLWRPCHTDKEEEDATSMITLDGGHMGFNPGHELTKVKGPERMKWMR